MSHSSNQFRNLLAMTLMLSATGSFKAEVQAQPIPSTPGMGFDLDLQALPANTKNAVFTIEQLERFIGPTPSITLAAEDEPVQNLLDDIGFQAGLKLRATEADSNHIVSLNMPRPVPFWDAVLALMNKTDLSVDRQGSSFLVGKPRIQPQIAGPSFEIGSFKLIGLGASRSMSAALESVTARLKPIAGTSHAEFFFQFLPHPKMHVTPSAASSFVEAVDDLGNSYEAKASQYLTTVRYLESDLFPTEGHRMIVPNISTEARSFKKIRGNIWLNILLRSQRWEVNDILNAGGTSKNFANVNVTVQNVVMKDETYSLDVVAEPYSVPDPFGAGPTHNIEISRFGIFNEIDKVARLLDSEGKPLRLARTKYDNRGNNENRLKVTLEFRRTEKGGIELISGAPASLVWDMPIDIRAVLMTFEFKNIALQ
jgi:hypothetical protein